jgi:hypothetical protein
MVVILVVARDDVHRPAVAIAGAAAALVVSAWANAALQTNPRLLLDPRAVVAELTVGASLAPHVALGTPQIPKEREPWRSAT